MTRTHLARYIQAIGVFSSTGGPAHLLNPADGPQRDVQDHHHVLVGRQRQAGEQRDNFTTRFGSLFFHHSRTQQHQDMAYGPTTQKKISLISF